MLEKLKILASLILATLLLSVPVWAEDFTNTDALKNVSAVKAYFDVKAGGAAKLEKRLHWIDDTYKQLTKKGVKAEFVIGFRGEASYFVTKGDDDYIFEEDAQMKKKIYSWIKRFKKLGFVLEQCGISAGLYDIEPEDFLEEVKVVQSSYVSTIAYQAKGYSFVPMH